MSRRPADDRWRNPHPARRRAHIEGVVLIFHGDRNAMQRSNQLSGSGELAIQFCARSSASGIEVVLSMASVIAPCFTVREPNDLRALGSQIHGRQ